VEKPNLQLNKQGVLGINARNLDYILANNRRKFYPLVDDKVQTKSWADGMGIQSPEIYGVIEYQQQVKYLPRMIEGKSDFVIKPAHGSGGGGIMVITDVVTLEDGSKSYLKGSGKGYSLADIQYHVSQTLSGLYALGGVTDQAIIQYRVKTDPFFDAITYQGVPDIRLIVYHGVPVMAMLRLPTKKSDGKANLHTGGIGVGIEIKTGRTTHAVQHNHPVTKHPDTGGLLRDLIIPHWDAILQMGARFEASMGLGYIGVDIVIDKELGPMLLEANARPGISIQIANQSGLKARLKLVGQHLSSLQGMEQKIAFAREHF